MPDILINMLILAGMLLLTAGIWLAFGDPAVLIFWGVMLTAGAVTVGVNKRRGSV